MQDAPTGFPLAARAFRMLDADGDGRIDLLVTTDTLSGYFFTLRFGGLWDRRSFQRAVVAQLRPGGETRGRMAMVSPPMLSV